jgi:hypothetical protein
LDRELPSVDTLLKLLSVCDELLLDEEWLSARPLGWRDELETLRVRLETQLREHAIGT